MKKIVLVLGIAALLFAACGSSPSSSKASKEPDLTGVTSYYVRADGNDSNAGTLEDRPFKTLAKAVQTASKTKVKTITVIGKLAGETEINNSGTDEILITGKADTSDSEKAVLTTSTEEENTIVITGNSNIKLEYITLNTITYLPIIYTEGDKVKLTLGKNVVVYGNGKDAKEWASSGGGILITKGGTLIMMDNSTVTNCMAEAGGGVLILGSKMFIQDNAVISNNYADIAGGGIFVNHSTLEMKNNAIIKGNTAFGDNTDYTGGGIFCISGTIKLHDNSSVTGNTAPFGGGIYMRVSDIQTADGLELKGSGVYESRQVSGNTATTKKTPSFLQGKMPNNICVMNY